MAPAALTLAPSTLGTFRALVASWTPAGGRVLMPGAVEKLGATRPELRLDHNPASRWGEVTGYEETDEGLVIVGRNDDTPLGRQVYAGLGPTSRWSFQMWVTRSRKRANGVVQVERGRLLEVSLSRWPVDPLTRLLWLGPR